MADVAVQTSMPRWWGEYAIEIGQTHRWTLGGLELSITRLEKEWVVNTCRARQDPEAFDCDPEVALDQAPLEQVDEHWRVAGQGTIGRIQLRPMMADRSFVARPWDKLHILPDQQATLYVGAFLWLWLILDGSDRPALEIPIRRMSETWFGPSPRMGELCYASRTHAYTEFDKLAARPYRAIVPVTIQNKHREPLAIERLNIPVPYLDVYRSNQTSGPVFWFRGLTMVREQDRSEANIRIDHGAPVDAGDCENIAAARKQSESGLLVRAKDMLFA